MAVPSNLSTSPPSSLVQSDNEQPGPSAVPVVSVANSSGAQGPKTQDTSGINQPPCPQMPKQKILPALQKPEVSNSIDILINWLKSAKAEPESQRQTAIIHHYKIYKLYEEELSESKVKKAGTLFSKFNKTSSCIFHFNYYEKHEKHWYPLKASGSEKIIEYFLSQMEKPLSQTSACDAMLTIFCFSYGGKKHLPSEIYQKVFDRCKALENTHQVCGNLAYQHGVSVNQSYANAGWEVCKKYSLEDYLALVDGSHPDFKFEPRYGPSTVSVANSSGAEGPETQDSAGINQPPLPPKTPEQKILQAIQDSGDIFLTERLTKLTKWLQLAKEKPESQRPQDIVRHYRLYELFKEDLPEQQGKEIDTLFFNFDKKYHCIYHFNFYRKHKEHWFLLKESGSEKIIAYFLSQIEKPLSQISANDAMQTIFCLSYGGKKHLPSEIYQNVFEGCKALEKTYKVCGRLAYQHGVSLNQSYTNEGCGACEKYNLDDYLALVNGSHVDSKFEPR